MGEWKINKVSISELQSFLNKTNFSTNSVIPISPLRVKSYCSNPKAKNTDIALYYILNDNCIIAFRTVWADEIVGEKGTIRFGWCSGNWVSPKWRRKGLSMLLLKEMYNDWDEKLMFTNYAPESLNAYLKSGLFPYVFARKGKRFYLNSSFFKLLSQKSNSRIWKTIAYLLAKFFRIYYFLKISFFKLYNINDFDVEEHNAFKIKFIPDHENLNHSFFARTQNDYQWIFKYPWVTTQKNEILNYPFTYFVKDFQFRFLTLTKNDQIIGKLILSNRNKKVKLLFLNPVLNTIDIFKYLINFCAKNKIDTLTILNEDWSSQLKEMRTPFVWSKAFTMNIYSTFELDNKNGKIVFDGDGDYIFT